MLPFAPATSAVSELPPLSVRRCPDRGGLGGDGGAICLTCPFTTVHTPTPAMPLLARLGNRASLLLHRLVYAFPAAPPPTHSPTSAPDGSPNFDPAPAPEPAPALSFMGSGYGVTLILMVSALPLRSMPPLLILR